MTRRLLRRQSIDWLPILAVLQVILASPPAAAQIIDWDNVSGGSYATAGNWNPADVPNTAAETAQFNLANTFRVTFNSASSTTIDDLLASDGVVTFSNTGGSDATLNISDDALIDGGDLLLDQFLTTGDVNFNISDLLLVGGGATLSVLDGASVTANTLDLGITGSGNGTILVDGVGSLLAVAGNIRVGGFGKTGTLTFQNGSTGNSLGGLTQLIGGSSATGSTGRLNVLSGASLQTASINVGLSNSASAVQEGALTVSGADSLLTMTGASTLTIGDETNPNVTADVIVSSGGQLDTGTGAVTIQNSGNLRVSGGTFNANGLITMGSGSRLSLFSDASINAKAGLDNSAGGILELYDGTLTVTGGAFSPNAGGPTDDYIIDGLTPADMPHLVIGAGATATIGHNLYVGADNRAELTIIRGATIASSSGFASTIGVNSGSTGTVTVDGAGSTWTNLGTFFRVGYYGNGTLNILNGGTVSSGWSSIATFTNSVGKVTVDGDDGLGNASNWTAGYVLTVGSEGNGTLNIQNGGAVSSQFAGIGLQSGSTSTATVDGAGSTWTNSDSLYIGGNSTNVGGTGTLNVQNSGLVEVGGPLKIWNTSTLHVAGGTLDADDLITMTAGSTLTLTSGGSINANAGLDNSAEGTLELFNGTLAVTGGAFVPNAGDVQDDYVIDGLTPGDMPHLVIGAGATANIGRNLYVGDANQGELTIIGGGKVSSDLGIIGDTSGSTGSVTVDGTDGTGNPSTWTVSNFSNLAVGSSGDGTLNILRGGAVSNSRGFIGLSSGSTGTVTVDGSDGLGNPSTWMNSSGLRVGGSTTLAGGTGTLNVQNSGLVQVDATFKIWTDGAVNLSGGTLQFNGPLEDAGGTFNFTSGVMNVNDATQMLIAGSGGNNTVGGLVLGSSFVLGTGQTLNLAGNARVDLGGQLALGGGTLTGPSLLVQPGGSVVNTTGSSMVTTPLLALAGSSINVTGGDLTIGDATAVNGFYGSGSISVAGGRTLTLEDSNDVVLDSGILVALGEAASHATLAAANGLTLDFGGNITGFGTVSTPNDPTKPLINNGHIAGNSLPDEPITLTGYVKGVGTLDNVIITGTDAPGFSPATVVRGSVQYAGLLEIEVEGNAAGEFDRIEHILGAGVAELGGTLQVAADPNVDLQVGDSLVFLVANGGVLSSFDTVQLPELADGRALRLVYGETIVGLEVYLAGDYNGDGVVDAADYTVWRDNQGSPAGTLDNDPNPGAIGAAQYATWRANFGATAIPSGSLANSTVPEPSTGVLVMLFALTLARRSRMVRY